MVSGKLPVRYACASASSRFLHPLPLQPPELVDDEPQRLARHLGSRVGIGDDVARVLERVDVGRGAIGQAAIRAQHAVQPVAAFATEDVDRQIERQVVLVPARQADVADANLGLHRTGTVDDDDAPGRRRRIDRLGRQCARSVPHLPNARSAPANASSWRDVADDREDGVVGAEPGLVERDEVVARDARNRLRRARVGPAVGWKP